MPDLVRGTNQSTVLVCLIAVWVLWGSVYLGIRVVVAEAAPFQAMAQRFLAAGLILCFVVIVRRGIRGVRVSRRQLLSLLVTGVLLLGIGNGLMALAMVRGLPSGTAALIVAAVPAWAVLLRTLTGDHPSGLTLFGVAIGFGGLLILVGYGSGVGGSIPLIGAGLGLIASLSWTIGSFLQGRLELPADIFTIAAYQQLIAAGCAATLAVGAGETISVQYSSRGWLAMGHLVVGCSIVGFLGFAWLLTHVPLSLTATHAYVNPVVAVALGWLVLGEQVGLPVLLGGGIVVSSVVLIVTAENRAAHAAGVDVEADLSTPPSTR